MSRLALVHGPPIEPVLDRRQGGAEDDADPDAEEREAALARREAAVLLEHDRKSGELRVQGRVGDRDVQRDERDDGLREQEA